MAEEFGFYDPVEITPDVWDREYNAEQFTKYFRALVTTGIMKGAEAELKVSANGSNMIVAIDAGVAFVVGQYYRNTASLPHTLDTEVLGRSRIDRIVVRHDMAERKVTSFVKKGVASATPVAPVLTQTANLYEISLAQVKVVGGQTYVNVADVVDERGKDVICPWAGSNILPNFDDAGLAELVEKVDAGLVDATTTRKGITKLNNTLTSASTTEAATANVVKQLNDTKVNRVQPAFTTVATKNGWISIDPVKYYKDETGVVHVQGWIQGGITAANTVLFTFPTSLAPLVGTGMVAVGTHNLGTDGRTVPIYYDKGNWLVDGTSLAKITLNFSYRSFIG